METSARVNLIGKMDWSSFSTWSSLILSADTQFKSDWNCEYLTAMLTSKKFIVKNVYLK
jgi:hypothetical protein